MTIDFTCQKCEGNFELDASDLIEGTEKLVCPHCDNKASANMVDDFTSALTELRVQVANMSKKFYVSLAVESDELSELEDEDDEEDAEDDDDDDLDFDDDGDEDLEDEDVEER